MNFRRLTPDNQLRLHLSQAQEYWRQDRLDLASLALQKAQRVGFPPGSLYDFQRMIEAEYNARLSAQRIRISEHLIIEAEPSFWGGNWERICRIAQSAVEEVEGTLDARWSKPVLITLIPDQEWVAFLHARYGYYTNRSDSHKVCLPPVAIRPPSQFLRAVKHEAAHAAVHQLAGESVPRWLNEGIAVNMEGGVPWPGNPVRLSLDSITAGFESYDVELGSPRSHLSYAGSGEFVAGLLRREGWAGVRRLLTQLNSDIRIDRAFREIYDEPIRQAEKQWMKGGLPALR
jgi:hypothetical protein